MSTGPEELLGTGESALCSGLSVTPLTFSGASTYQGEMAASGSWAVSGGANAIRLEYYEDWHVGHLVLQPGGNRLRDAHPVGEGLAHGSAELHLAGKA